MTPSLEHFKALLATAETGSFSAAARRLGKAQSVVSAAIANLEIDLGLALFDRSGRYPVLTEAATHGDAKAAKIIVDLLGDVAGENQGGVQIIDDL